MLNEFLDKADIDQAISNVKSSEADARLIAGEEFKIIKDGIVFTSDFHKYEDKSKIRVYKSTEFSFDLKMKFSVPDKEIKETKSVHRSTTEKGVYMLEELSSIKNGVRLFRIISEALNKHNQDGVIFSDKQLEQVTGLSSRTIRTVRKNLIDAGFIATCKIGNLLVYVATPELMFNNYFKSRVRAQAVMNNINDGGIPDSFKNMNDNDMAAILKKELKY